jgi:hypothetical protein
MLFEKTHSFIDGDIVTIKMISGEEVITKFSGYTNDDCTSFKIQKPYILAQTPKGPGLAPFILTGEDGASVTLEKGTFVCMVKTDPDMATQYTSVTTGITLSTGPNIMEFPGS